MSFSLNVKKEIYMLIKTRHCAIAELSAIIDYCSDICYNPLFINISSDNELLLKKFKSIIKFLFNIDIYISTDNGKTYKIFIHQQIMAKHIKFLYKIKT